MDGTVIHASELLQVEERGWKALQAEQAGEFFEELMTDNARMILPGAGVLHRGEVAERLRKEPAWSTFEMHEARLTHPTKNAILITYVVTAERPEGSIYEAFVGSLYVNVADHWKLAFRQETPDVPINQM